MDKEKFFIICVIITAAAVLMLIGCKASQVPMVTAQTDTIHHTVIINDTVYEKEKKKVEIDKKDSNNIKIYIEGEKKTVGKARQEHQVNRRTVDTVYVDHSEEIKELKKIIKQQNELISKTLYSSTQKNKEDNKKTSWSAFFDNIETFLKVLVMLALVALGIKIFFYFKN